MATHSRADSHHGGGFVGKLGGGRLLCSADQRAPQGKGSESKKLKKFEIPEREEADAR